MCCMLSVTYVNPNGLGEEILETLAQEMLKLTQTQAQRGGVRCCDFSEDGLLMIKLSKV